MNFTLAVQHTWQLTVLYHSVVVEFRYIGITLVHYKEDNRRMTYLVLLLGGMMSALQLTISKCVVPIPT